MTTARDCVHVKGQRCSNHNDALLMSYRCRGSGRLLLPEVNVLRHGECVGVCRRLLERCRPLSYLDHLGKGSKYTNCSSLEVRPFWHLPGKVLSIDSKRGLPVSAV